MSPLYYGPWRQASAPTETAATCMMWGSAGTSLRSAKEIPGRTHVPGGGQLCPVTPVWRSRQVRRGDLTPGTKAGQQTLLRCYVSTLVRCNNNQQVCCGEYQQVLSLGVTDQQNLATLECWPCGVITLIDLTGVQINFQVKEIKVSVACSCFVTI